MGEDFLSVKKFAQKNSKKVDFLNLIQAGKTQKKLIYIVKD